jgi:hypothetical protein
MHAVRRITRSQTARRRRNINNPGGPPAQSWSLLSGATPALTRVARFDNRPYKIVQLVDIGPILTSSAGAATFYGTAFNLNQLPQVASIQNIFDQYRIDQLEVWITPNTNSSLGTSTMQYYTAIDYDTSATPTTLSQLSQYSNVMETSSNDGHYRRWRPHIGVAVGIPNTSVQGMANKKSDWIDCQTAGVNHNALVLGMQSNTTTTVLYLRVRFTISLRNVI